MNTERGPVHYDSVLIAQLAVPAGRAPLAHIADSVFRGLARSLREQGIRVRQLGSSDRWRCPQRVAVSSA